MLQTIKEIEPNVAYRWFIGYDFTQPIPHFSSFGKTTLAVFAANLIEIIFQHILENADSA